jgi:hypothetical protein
MANRWRVLQDVFALGLITGLLLAIFAPLLQFEFLQTGYQDWIYHAFRVKSLATFGFLSWDTVWSNGINHWQSYQYVPHFITLIFTRFFSLSIPKSMMVTMIAIAISGAVALYLSLRTLAIRPVAAWLAVLLFFTSPELWQTTKDYSIFFFIPFLSVILWVWAKGIERKQLHFALGALAGVSWMVHPILGMISAGLWAIAIFVSFKNISLPALLLHFVMYGLASLLFTAPYLLASPSFMSPHLPTADFVILTMRGSHWGLGLLLTVALGFSWFFLFLQAKHSPMWAKALLAYVTVILVFISLMRMGLAPKIIYLMQLSRSIPLLALCIAFAVAPTIQYVTRFRSRYFRSILVACVAILSLNVIDIASTNMPRGVKQTSDPVAEYFQTFPEPPTGSVWTENVSEASYLAPNFLRFAASYNHHREPHPYSNRVNGLMKNDLAFTGITNKQVSLLNSYSRVLGIEYIFLPKLSPLTASLTEASNSANTFRLAEKQITTSTDYAALKNTHPTQYAYEFPTSEGLLGPAPAFPTLASQSWEAWDAQIVELDEQLQSGKHTAVPLEFPAPDRLKIEVPKSLKADEGVLVMQSYDKSWRSTVPGLEILPTAQRFMFLKLPANWSGTIELKHSWPSWHIPVQIISFLVAFVTVITEGVYLTFIRRAPEPPVAS